MGILSLVLGLTCVASGLIGAIFGHLGLAACAKGEANNRGIALAGVIVNYVVLGLGLIGLMLYAAGGGSSPSSTPTRTSGFAEPPEPVPPAGMEGIDYSRTVDTSISSAPLWYNLSVGQCVSDFWLEDGAGDTFFVEPGVLPCEGIHYGEVFIVARVSGTAPVNDETFNHLVSEVCEGPEFASYVGVGDYLESSIYWDVLYPDDDFWNSGNHDMVCLLVEEGDVTVGSLKGSGL